MSPSPSSPSDPTESEAPAQPPASGRRGGAPVELPTEVPPTRALPFGRFAIVFALVALDLWSKHAVFQHIDTHPELLERDAHGHDRWPIFGEWFTFMKSLNPGMAFGLFGDQQTVLVIGRVIAVAVLSVMLWRFQRIAKPAGWALVLVLAGALGNLYDNLFLGTVGAWLTGDAELSFGKVRDFIDVYFAVWDYHFATFNVADACISVGAVLLLFFWGKEDKHVASAEATP